MRVQSYNELVKKFNEAYPHGYPSSAEKLTIEGVWQGYAPHNPSAPVWVPVGGRQQLVMAVRLEACRERMESVSLFCEPSNTKEDLHWRPIERVRILPAEDPFITTIHGEIVVMCKQALPVSSHRHPVPCCTVMYRGKDIRSLRRCAVWNGVNCAHPIELKSGDVGVFTRKKEGTFGHGVIEWRIAETLGDLTQEGLDRVPPTFLDVFSPGEWGSVNEPHLCSDGVTIGVVGHVAKQVSRTEVQYAAMAFEFKPRVSTWSPLRIIATRESFLDGRAKCSGVKKVVHPGGVRFVDGKAVLYAGTSDAEVQRDEISISLVDFYQ